MSDFIKTILPSSFNYDDATSSLVDVWSRGVDGAWMAKRAAAGIFKDADIRPEKDYSFIHLIAMGDMETWGCNRNADGFKKTGGFIDIPHPRDGKTRRIKIAVGNRETHKTFETHAKVYRDHVHDSVAKACGDVVKSAHNDPMSRVELIIKVPDKNWQPELEKLASGGDVPWSMSTRIPYDICLECGNKAASRKQYCVCMRDHAGTITKEGRYIGVVNDHMIYFDISKVTVPADRTAFGLLKVAAAAGKTVTGAELAEQLGIAPSHLDDLRLDSRYVAKLAMLRKLSEIEKQIEATARGQDNHDIKQMAAAFDPEVSCGMPDELREAAQACPREQLADVLGQLSDAKICLSLKDFMKLLMGRRYSEVESSVPQACGKLPGIFQALQDKPEALSDMSDFPLGTGPVSSKIRDAIQSAVPGMSLADEPVQRRITIMVVRGKRPGELKADTEKLGSADNSLAAHMATAYAVYKMAFCRQHDDNVAMRAVLQHYL